MDVSAESLTARPCKYVVLHHAGIEEPHYDFMFEPAEGEALVTFRLAEWPPSGRQEVRRLKDHRRLYLTFEGTIPGDRGYVVRVDKGMLHPRRDGVRWILRRDNGEPWMTVESLEGGDEGDWWLVLSAQ